MYLPLITNGLLASFRKSSACSILALHKTNHLLASLYKITAPLLSPCSGRIHFAFLCGHSLLAIPAPRTQRRRAPMGCFSSTTASGPRSSCLAVNRHARFFWDDRSSSRLLEIGDRDEWLRFLKRWFPECELASCIGASKCRRGGFLQQRDTLPRFRTRRPRN